MPTVVMVRGWRVFFYSEEGNEPIHVHVRKGECEAKFWLRVEEFDIEEAWSHGMKPQLRREIRRIIFDNFDLIVDEWNRHLGDTTDANN
jgi:hypothetical protein